MFKSFRSNNLAYFLDDLTPDQFYFSGGAYTVVDPRLSSVVLRILDPSITTLLFSTYALVQLNYAGSDQIQVFYASTSIGPYNLLTVNNRTTFGPQALSSALYSLQVDFSIDISGPGFLDFRVNPGFGDHTTASGFTIAVGPADLVSVS